MPSCLPGCFSGGDCTLFEECDSDLDCSDFRRPTCQQDFFDPERPGRCVGGPLDVVQKFACVDAPAGQVQNDLLACREAFFSSALTEENRDGPNPTIGTCCESGCLNRNADCVGTAQFCCNEPGSPFEEAASCLNIVAGEVGLQAQPGDCFEAPVQPFCQQCGSNADCNFEMIEGLVDMPGLPFNPATTFEPSQNSDCEGCSPEELEAFIALGGQINNGVPFTEFQRCTNLAPQTDPPSPPYNVCTVSYDPKIFDDTGDPRNIGMPSGWTCAARAPVCLEDSQCNGLTCVGVEINDMGQITSFGNCQCGEDGTPFAACPDQTEDVPVGMFVIPGINAPTRMRCAEARTRNFQGPASAQVGEGDMFCVYTYDCQGPTLQFPNPETTAQSLPDACGMPGVYND